MRLPTRCLSTWTKISDFSTDIARAIISLVENQAEGIFNLGSGESISTKVLLNMIYEKFGKELKVRKQDNISNNNIEEFSLDTT
ncbi:MAG: hypothetical protein VW991_01270, partial [Aquiluna sp.]